MLFCELLKKEKEGGKSRDDVISILGNVSFLMGQPKKDNVSFSMGQREY